MQDAEKVQVLLAALRKLHAVVKAHSVGDPRHAECQYCQAILAAEA